MNDSISFLSIDAVNDDCSHVCVLNMKSDKTILLDTYHEASLNELSTVTMKGAQAMASFRKLSHLKVVQKIQIFS